MSNKYTRQQLLALFRLPTEPPADLKAAAGAVSVPQGDGDYTFILASEAQFPVAYSSTPVAMTLASVLPAGMGGSGLSTEPHAHHHNAKQHHRPRLHDEVDESTSPSGGGATTATLPTGGGSYRARMAAAAAGKGRQELVVLYVNLIAIYRSIHLYLNNNDCAGERKELNLSCCQSYILSCVIDSDASRWESVRSRPPDSSEESSSALSPVSSSADPSSVPSVGRGRGRGRIAIPPPNNGSNPLSSGGAGGGGGGSLSSPTDRFLRHDFLNFGIRETSSIFFMFTVLPHVVFLTNPHRLHSPLPPLPIL